MKKKKKITMYKNTPTASLTAPKKYTYIYLSEKGKKKENELH